LIITVNEQTAVLFEASVAVQETVVTPFAKADPEAGEHTNGLEPSGQLSVTVGAKFTMAVQRFGSVPCEIGAGQVIDGG